MGHLRLPPGLRPPRRPPRRRGRGRPPAPRLPPRPPRRPLRRATPRPTSTGGTRSPSPATTASRSAAARSSRRSASTSRGGGPDLGVVHRGRRRHLRPVAGRSATPTGRSGTTPSPARSAGSWATRSRSGSSTTTGPPPSVYTLNSRKGDPLAMRHPLRHHQAGQGGQHDPRLRLRLRDADARQARVGSTLLDSPPYGPAWTRIFRTRIPYS